MLSSVLVHPVPLDAAGTQPWPGPVDRPARTWRACDAALTAFARTALVEEDDELPPFWD